MKKNIFSLLFLFGITISLFAGSAHSALAQTKECDDLKAKFNNTGVNGSSLVDSLPIYCTEGDVFGTVTGILYGLVGVVAVLAVIYGGYLYMTAGSNADQAKKGRQVLLYTVIGVLVVLTATLIVTVVSRFIVDNKVF